MDKKGYLVGTQSEVWKLGAAQQVTFIVTEDCNIATLLIKVVVIE